MACFELNFFGKKTALVENDAYLDDGNVYFNLEISSSLDKINFTNTNASMINKLFLRRIVILGHPDSSTLGFRKCPIKLGQHFSVAMVRCS